MNEAVYSRKRFLDENIANSISQTDYTNRPRVHLHKHRIPTLKQMGIIQILINCPYNYLSYTFYQQCKKLEIISLRVN